MPRHLLVLLIGLTLGLLCGCGGGQKDKPTADQSQDRPSTGSPAQKTTDAPRIE